ncbi:SusC/RagA family TonB-linked outer membrane protein [Lunatibacter salilacus]|uniref:SusC/RagA family TonB-linked outer membrane protein n=1 Tax=Lunatibacter salilacus TaxID=2483804 RepID=UPI00131A6814|nr:TonB-dependent receptor [Lunatibacter salilacus]
MKNKLLKTIIMLSKCFLYGLVLQTLLLNLVLALNANGQYKNIEEVRVTLSSDQLSLNQFFKEVQRQTPFKFSYEHRDVDRQLSVTFAKKEGPVIDFLREAAQQSELSFRQVNHGIDVLKRNNGGVEVIDDVDIISITGTILDENGEPLPGATVTVEGSTVGTVTDIDGNYSIDVDEGAVLVVSFIGYKTKRITVTNQTQVNFAMELDESSLEEVVVIGYGEVQKSDLTGSVSSVKGSDLAAFPASNPVQALSGRAAGVQVTQNTGAPGAPISVRIRGTNSIQGNNEPLYVIDGFPYSGNPNLLNNPDIESVEILKDASATAIYGSRGANGVVLITTKRGKGGVTKVDYEGSVSIQKIRNKIDLMDAREFATFYNIQATNDNLTPYFSNEEVNNFERGYDWQDGIFQDAPINSQSLSISGGTEKTQFLISGSFFNQDGIVRNSNFNRTSLRANVSHKLNDVFSVDFNTTLSRIDSDRQSSGGGNRGGSLISGILSAPPTLTPYEDDGGFTMLNTAYSFSSNVIVNPFNYTDFQTDHLKSNNVLTNAAVTIRPIKGLSIRISGGIENADNRTDFYRQTQFVNSFGNANIASTQYTSILNENIINYTKSFGNSHHLTITGGFTYQDFLNTSLSASGSGFISDVSETYELSAAEIFNVPNTSYSKAVLLSYLGRVNYGFKDKLLATISFRSDGSSRFSPGEKWSFFPSAALAYRLSEEDFIKRIDFISDLKIRSSFGVTGNQAISPYQTLNQLFARKTVFNSALFTSYAPGTRLPNNLKWETTFQTNIGLDLGLFDNRIFFTMDYYKKNTRDLLNTVSLPASLGYLTTLQNIGEVENRGLELNVDAQILENNFKWKLNGNISFNRNKVIELYDGQDILSQPINIAVVNDVVNILREGLPMGVFYGFKESGYDENGKIKFVDFNENGMRDAGDKTVIGDPNPDFIYGLNSTMSYKNFDLNIFIQGSYGNDIFNVSAINQTLDYGFGLNLPREVLYDNWTPENVNAKYPVISRTTQPQISDRFVEDGSFLRLRNIQLTYNFQIERLRYVQVYLSAQNWITFTKYSWFDPEINTYGSGNSIRQGIDHYSYPTAKTFTVGLRLGF